MVHNVQFLLDIIISPALAELILCSIGDEVELRCLDADQIATTYCIFVDSALFDENKAHRMRLEYLGKNEAHIRTHPSLRTFSTVKTFCLDKDHDIFRTTQKTKYFALNPSTMLSCLRPFDVLSIVTKLTGIQDTELCSTRTYEKILARIHKFDSADIFAKKSSDVIDKRITSTFKSSITWSDIAGQHEIKNRLLECFSISEKVNLIIID